MNLKLIELGGRKGHKRGWRSLLIHEWRMCKCDVGAGKGAMLEKDGIKF